MELHPNFDFLPKPDHRIDLNQFHEPTPPSVSSAVRKELMALALRFQAMEPWKQMGDNELFGIRDADTNALHLISVLGFDGDLFSLHCHMPPEGITFWQSALLGQDSDPAPGLTELRLLECDFMDAADASPEDLSLLKKFGKKQRGTQKVPCFRSYRPGFYPWFLEEYEAEKLISVFQLFFRFQEEILPQRDKFYQWENPFGEMPGIPVFYINRDDDPKQVDAWQVKMEVLPTECLAPLKPRPDVDPEISELNIYPRVDETWEIASFYMPSPVFQGERPYYPKTAICLRATDNGSRCPCDPIVYGGDYEEDTNVIRQAFKDLVEHCQFLPETIRVDSKSSYAALESYADEYDLELQLDAQELMPYLVTEIVHSLEGNESQNWEEELLDAVVAAIPNEFQRHLGDDDMEKSVAELTDRMFQQPSDGFDSEALEENAQPDNIIFADFSSQRAAGSE